MVWLYSSILSVK